MSFLATRSLEKRAVKTMLERLESIRQKLPTSLSADFEELKMLPNSPEANFSSSSKLVLALIYRVTIKRILEIAIQRLHALAMYLDNKVDTKMSEDIARQIWLVPAYLDTLSRLVPSSSEARQQQAVSEEGLAELRQYLVEINSLPS
jgi:hypothetical protein